MAQLPDGDVAPLDGALPSSVLANSSGKTLHAYLHIPFCRVRCGYCDFNTYTSTELRGVTQNSFLDDLLAEIRFSRKVLERAELPERKFSTVFFGGGTPTQLSATQLVQALNVLRDEIGIEPGAEITTEANPDNVDHVYLAELAAGGFTRISIGMQSAVPSVLKTLDRTHKPENVAKAVQAAKDAGLQVSVDLIYGAPGETIHDWRTSVEAAIALEPDHISAYSLIVEDGTKLARQIRSGELPQPDEDDQAEKYEVANDLLSKAGFDWYEVSNFSKTFETRSAHNLAYWKSNDWWGYGPGAHSHVGGVRWWNVKHPATFAQKIAESASPALAREVLTDETRITERILLEVRISDGLAIDVVKSLNADAAKPISQAIADGLIQPEAAIRGNLILTLKGRLLADALVRDLLG
ncbi:MAG: coproporphyrinogen III oxidase [Rhodoluna sp.]|nr:coproporphyrinogen III oxidase [Rhodoluna sp.]MBP6186144.1 coproporphyrinogen III oxidase [Rhodoluna sp.]